MSAIRSDRRGPVDAQTDERHTAHDSPRTNDRE